MSKPHLVQWSKDHGLPHSHNKRELIEQAKSRRRILVVHREKTRKGKWGNPIWVDSDSDHRDHTYTGLEGLRSRDDANGPGKCIPASYTYSQPAAEEEPTADQAQAELEDEYLGRQGYSHDVGPFT